MQVQAAHLVCRVLDREEKGARQLNIICLSAADESRSHSRIGAGGACDIHQATFVRTFTPTTRLDGDQAGGTFYH